MYPLRSKGTGWRTGKGDKRMADAATKFKGKQVEVEIFTDTYKIRGTLFVPLAAKDGYSTRLSDFLNNPEKAFLALTHVSVEALPDPDMKWDTPFLAVNKSVITMVRAIKE
jgi:uncharacterized protein DUF6812